MFLVFCFHSLSICLFVFQQNYTRKLKTDFSSNSSNLCMNPDKGAEPGACLYHFLYDCETDENSQDYLEDWFLWGIELWCSSIELMEIELMEAVMCTHRHQRGLEPLPSSDLLSLYTLTLNTSTDHKLSGHLQDWSLLCVGLICFRVHETHV